MTQVDLTSNPIFTGILLSDAVGEGNGARIRELSSDIKSDVIQANTTQTYLNIFFLLNSLDNAEFPTDVWAELPNFLISDIKDRAIILGCSEELLSGMTGSFMHQNFYAAVTGGQSKLLNPDGYAAGYFHVAAAMGEAIFGALKVAANLRFNGDYELTRNMVIDWIAMQYDIEKAG